MIDLDAAIRGALKQQNQVALNAYRSLKTKAVVKMTEAGREGDKQLSEEELLALVRREIKERAESNEFLDAGDSRFRDNQGIIDLLGQYLPAQLSAEDTETLIQEAIASTGATAPKDMGAVMKALRESGKPLDMGTASARVKELLRS